MSDRSNHEPEPDIESQLAARDPAFMSQWWPIVRQAQRIWHRPEVRGIERIPEGACLIVSNHSGGTLSMDAPILFEAFSEHHGMERPGVPAGSRRPVQDAARLAHAALGDRAGPSRGGPHRAGERRGRARLPGRRPGRLPADHVLDRHRLPRPHRLPDARRRSRRADRAGRVDRRPGDAAVPHQRRPARERAAVPAVAAHPRLPADARHAVRRLPAEPADAVEDRGSGARPDRAAAAGRRRRRSAAAVDKHVRAVMQRALNQLARERRLPVLG